MPYEIAFRKRVEVTDPDIYVNPCCWGGDAIVRRLLPAVERAFRDVWSEQEDWGWFVRFRRGRVGLAIDVRCDDPAEGAFRLRLTSRRKRWFRPEEVVDGPELETVRELVLKALTDWSASSCTVTRIDAGDDTGGVS